MSKDSDAKPVYDAILIDDDSETHDLWRLIARRLKGHFVGFLSSREFFDNADVLDRKIPVYIDSDLHEEFPGEIVAKEIRERGFETIFLQSEMPVSDDLSQMTWLTAVVGKATPWDEALGIK